MEWLRSSFCYSHSITCHSLAQRTIIVLQKYYVAKYDIVDTMSLFMCTAIVMEVLESSRNFSKIIFIFHFLLKVFYINLCLHKPEWVSRDLSLYNCTVEFFGASQDFFIQMLHVEGGNLILEYMGFG